jgi:NADPH-dependent stearoyl-CoA 9-desaturase
MTTEAAELDNPIKHLTAEQLDQLGRRFDAIHDKIYEDLGDRDRRYIVSMIEMHRRLGVFARVELLGSELKALWLLGTATLASAKILENMEIGHNVLHGQWDWMNDPAIHSTTWDWDTASTAEAWKHSHNFVHHTFTNIRGKDKDLGYEIMRIDPHQKWHPVYLLQPFYNVLLMLFFEWGVAFHDLDLEAVRKGEKDKDALREELKGIAGKARAQIVKDYVAWPLISAAAAGGVAGGLALARGEGGKGWRDAFVRHAKRTFRRTIGADVAANLLRNIWSNAIIFCGHFPDQTWTFSQKDVENETRGGWYVRQLLGAANIEGSPFFHVASGNLGYQVEHHLFPDMPSTRYAEIAPRVKAICEEYELPYNTGPFVKQWLMVQRTILRLAFPGGRPRPKPGPFRPAEGELEAAMASMPPLKDADGSGPPNEHGSGPEQADDGVRVSVPPPR